MTVLTTYPIWYDIDHMSLFLVSEFLLDQKIRQVSLTEPVHRDALAELVSCELVMVLNESWAWQRRLPGNKQTNKAE